MKQIAVLFSLLLALLAPVPAPAQMTMSGVGGGFGVAAGGGCAQATTFLARTSGLSGGQTTAYTNLICGLVTDGVITGSLSGAAACGTGSFDGLWVFASNTTTTANLNLCGTNLSNTVVGGCTFTANAGYTGNGLTCALDTGFTASTATNMTLNSGSWGACNYVSGPGGNIVGSWDGGVGIGWDGGGAPTTELNGSTFPATALTVGSMIVTRTASTAINVYSNGSLNASPADTSGHLSTQRTLILANNNNAGGTPSGFSTAQVSYAFFGGGFNATQVGNIYARLHTFLTAVSAPAGC